MTRTGRSGRGRPIREISRLPAGTGLGRRLALGLGILLGLTLSARGSQEAPSHLRVSCEGGLLSAEAEGVSVTALFDEVGRRCGIGMAYVGFPRRDVSARLDPVPIGQGLTMLLRQAGVDNHAEVWGSIREGETPRPERLILLGMASGTPAPGPTDSPPSDAPPTNAVAGEEPGPPMPASFAREEILARVADAGELPGASPVEGEFGGLHRTALAIASVDEDSLLGLVGIQPGDVLVDVNGIAIDSREALAAVFAGWKGGRNPGIRFELVRNGQVETRYVVSQ